MKILVTGSSGFVGTHLVKKLRSDHNIVQYDLKQGYDVLNEKELSKKLSGCDIVIHLAAYVSTIESWKKPYDYFQNNGIGTLKVVTEAINAGVKRLIYFSSAAVYGNPLTPYGASKSWGELVCETYKNKIEIVVFRPFNIYGRGQNPTYGYVIYNFIDGIKEKGSVNIYGSGLQTRDFVFIDDVIRVVEKALTTKNIPNLPIDLGTAKKTRIIDLANVIGKLLKRRFDVKYMQGREESYESFANIVGLKGIGVDASKFTTLDSGLKHLLEVEDYEKD